MTKFNTPILREAIASVLAPTKSPLTDYHSFILLRYSDSGVASVEAYNGTVRCSNIATLVEGDSIECLMKASMAINALSGSNDDATIELNADKTRATVVIGKRKTVIPCLPVTPENWAEAKQVKPTLKFQLEKVNVFDSLKLCASIAKGSAAKARSIDNVDFATIDGVIHITGADGAAAHYTSTGVKSGEFKIAVPPGIVLEVLSNCESDLIAVRVYENSVKFQCGDWSIETSLSANTPVASRIVETVKRIKSDKPVPFSVNRKEFASAITSASSIVSDLASPRVRVESAITGISVSSESGTASMKSEIDASVSGEAFLLIDGVRLTPLITDHDSEVVEMAFTETAMVVEHSENSTSILMAIRAV